ncbi:MAG: membrane protein insertion efficiency factor YidD [Thermotogae bacterium]|nr:membrane protein insertion efficiency factor YidD [Thermotogota bacterium]
MLAFVLAAIPPQVVSNPPKLLAWSFIRIYQFFLSDIQPDVCNFAHPISCSRYGRKAVEEYGVVGVLMALDRLQRCNPGSHALVGYVYSQEGGKLVDSLHLFSPNADEVPHLILR